MQGAIYNLCSTNTLAYVSLRLCMLHVYARVKYDRRMFMGE